MDASSLKVMMVAKRMLQVLLALDRQHRQQTLQTLHGQYRQQAVQVLHALQATLALQ